MLSDNTKLYFD